MSVELAALLRLAETGQTRTARRLLADKLREAPGDLDLHFARGIVALRDRDFAEAREALEGVVAGDPDRLEAQHLLARVALEEQNYPEAERLLLAVLARAPEAASAYASYARVMLESLHLEKARQLAQESLRLDPEEEEAEMVTLLLDLIDGAKGDVRERMARMMAERPDELHVVASLFMVLVDAGRHTEALELGRELLRHQPNNQELVAGLVQLRAVTHWTTWPLRPFVRFGWGASAVVWVIAVAGLQLSRKVIPDAAGPLIVVFLAFVVYSWVWPPLLRSWLNRRGF